MLTHRQSYHYLPRRSIRPSFERPIKTGPKLPKFGFRNLLYFSAISLCLVGFLVQFHSLLVEYLKFETIVLSRLNRSIVVDLPAITICFPNSIKPDLLSKLTKKTGNEICNASLEDITKYQEEFFRNHDVPDINDKNFTIELESNRNIVDYEMANHTYGNKNCFDLKGSKVLKSFAFHHVCFTLFSRLDELHRNESLSLKLSGYAHLSINVSAMYSSINSNCNLIKESSPILSLHGRNTIPNLAEFSHKRLIPGRKYFIEFARTTTHAKPPPYATNCKFYMISQENGKKTCNQIQSRSDCMTACVKNRQMKQFTQVNASNLEESMRCLHAPMFLFRDCMLRDKLRMCHRNSKFSSESDYDFCLKRCPRACKDDIFDHIILDEFEKEKNGTIELLIDHKSVFDTIRRHTPYFAFAEFLSNVGGMLGGWTGWSVLCLFSYSEAFIAKIGKLQKQKQKPSMF